jgi:hypothetical protein
VADVTDKPQVDQTTISARELLQDLEARIDVAGGVVAWSRRAGISHTEVSLARSGTRQIGERIANACGYIAETRYRRIGGGIR